MDSISASVNCRYLKRQPNVVNEMQIYYSKWFGHKFYDTTGLEKLQQRTKHTSHSWNTNKQF